ncbi:hypothetical protein R3W88_007781 [Solanum pinnatisectum]|uniref:Uncharacterized protein n=1 Tax=Solanum pinnatisectum TaxID=50273 RepID=A0AAV9M9I1_9SOLN|nr:hypothetical protein R3W88_007781 [Solanum pinnatisectum]
MERVKGSFLLHALHASFRFFNLEMLVCLLLSLIALVGGCSNLRLDDNFTGIALVEQDYLVKSLLVRGTRSWGSSSNQREKRLVRTFSLQLKKILRLGIVQSLPFRQVKSTIKDYILFLERV